MFIDCRTEITNKYEFIVKLYHAKHVNIAYTNSLLLCSVYFGFQFQAYHSQFFWDQSCDKTKTIVLEHIIRATVCQVN